MKKKHLKSKTVHDKNTQTRNSRKFPPPDEGYLQKP